MKRCEDVRLRPGRHQLGDGVDFVVAETPQAVALLRDVGAQGFSPRGEAHAARLLEQGYPVVACIDLDAPASAVACCYSSSSSALEDTACGIWALKTFGDGDASNPMAFHISHAVEHPGEPSGCTRYRSGFVSVQAVGERLVEVRVVPCERWGGLACTLPPSVVLVVDVDWMQFYNDAYGHRQGDLALARVHACLERAAMGRTKRWIRVGGDKFALVLDGESAGAAALAESMRRAVETLDIPFEHPRCRTHGRVTVSVAVVEYSGDPHDGTALPTLVEDTVYQAKRAGRNCVATHLDHPCAS